MTTANWVWSSKTWATTTVIFGGILIAASDRTLAQVVPDNTLGSGRSRVTPIDQQNDRIDGGVLRGANLFHSFQDFGVEANRGVQFSNPTGVENIFSRVTGNTPSNIYGTLGVQGNANLFLLNPNGILFGPNARLDLRGSFVASTADSFVFPDGSQFSATNPTAPPLLEINVQAPIGLQFAGEQPGLIVNSGNLQVDPGQNLALAGGTVVSTGELSAPGGDIAVVTVQSNGVAPELMPVLQFSRRGQLLGQTVAPRLNDGSTASATVTSLPEMVTEWGANTGLAISPSGQVELADSGLSVAAGDVAVQQLHAATATLSAANDLTLAASHLETTGNLQLLAQDTVRARDSEATPFVASAGGELLVQGNQGVDIFALNHPSSGLFSGGDMVLRSANTVGGDAHYWSGGNFRIEQLNGTPGSLSSPHDPIVRAAGDVEFDSYNGASLHIFAGGSVRINNITITGPDIISQSIRENVTLSNGEVVPIDGSTQPTLDIRAGTTAFISTGIVGSPDGFTPAPPNTNGTGTSADIEIGNITITINDNPTPQERGRILLTNQYQPNPLLRGNISIGSINRNIFFQGSSIDVDSRNGITLNRNTSSGPAGGPNSDVTFLANGDITLNPGSYLAGRTVNLRSNAAINIIGGEIRSNSDNSNDLGEISISGNSVSLTDGASILADTNSQINASNVRIETAESFSLRNSRIRAITEGQGNAGDVAIHAGNSISFDGCFASGDCNAIFIITQGGGNSGSITLDAGNMVSLTRATLNAGTTTVGRGGDVNVLAENGISISQSAQIISSTSATSANPMDARGGNIFIQTDNGDISFENPISLLNPILSTFTLGSGDAGNITIRANNGSVSFENTEVNANVGSENRAASGDGGTVIIEANKGAVSLENAGVFARTYGSGNAGDISINARDRITVDGNTSRILSDSSREAGAAILGNSGDISLQSDFIDIGDQAAVRAATAGQGSGGDITIKANASISITRGAFLTSGTTGSGNGGNITVNAGESIAVSGEGSQLFSGSGTQAGCLDNQCRGGNIALSSNSIRLADRAEVGVATEGSGDSGNIRIRAIDSVVLSSGAQLNSGTSGSGDGGNIRIRNADSVTVRSGARLNSSTSGSGNGGNIRIRNADSVAVRDGARLNSSTSGSGDGGNIRIRNADSVSITGGAAANSSTLGTGNGGTITINARELIAISDRARINASTSGAGSGGSVFIQDADSVTISDRAQINASTSDAGEDAGDGGSVFIQDADSVNISDRAQVDAATSGTGSGGEVTIQSDTVSIDHAGISVRAEEEGDAGTIRISAGTLTLDNQADIAATAQISQGGNITLQTDDYVLMRRGSSISAISEGAGSQDGTIDLSDTGVIVTSPLEDNDVLARSERGGDIELNATLGFQIQQGLTQVEGRSDITGTGDISVNLNVDPNRSLTPLPAEPDSPEISNACQVSSDRRTAEFYNVGRGGLRSRPDEPLNPNTVAEDWIPLELAKDNSRSESNQAPVSQPPTSTSRASSPCQSL